MKITFASNYGNFDYEMSVELGLLPPLPEGVEKLLQQGLANIAYRVAGSAVDKALGVETGKGKEGRRGVKFAGETKLVDDKGVAIMVVDEDTGEKTEQWVKNQAVIEGTVNAKLKELAAKVDSDIPTGIEFKVVGEHEYGAGAESAMVRATEFVTALLTAPVVEGQESGESKLRSMFSFLGMLNAEKATADELVNFAHRKGLGISVKKGK